MNANINYFQLYSGGYCAFKCTLPVHKQACWNFLLIAHEFVEQGILLVPSHHQETGCGCVYYPIVSVNLDLSIGMNR